MVGSADLADTQIALWNCQTLSKRHDLDICGAENVISMLYMGMEKMGNYLKNGFDVSHKDYVQTLIASFQVVLTQIDGNNSVRNQYDSILLDPEKNIDDSVRERLLSIQAFLNQHRIHYTDKVAFHRNLSMAGGHIGYSSIQELHPSYPSI